MTDQQHPITPPPELLEKLKAEWAALNVRIRGELGDYLVTRAAQWGADQELEACREWVSKYLPYLGDFPMPEDKLRIARRPEPPSLKEDALAAVSVPQELLRQWCQSKPGLTPDELWRKIADNSAQWGADQELEACCEHIGDWFATPEYRRAELRAARRPKPASLKEQALSDFAHLMGELIGTERYKDRIASLRRALEALPND